MSSKVAKESRLVLYVGIFVLNLANINTALCSLLFSFADATTITKNTRTAQILRGNFISGTVSDKLIFLLTFGRINYNRKF